MKLFLRALAIFALGVCAAVAPGGEALPFQYRFETRETPRPLRIHVLVLDLLATNLEVAVAMGEDPDGEGPAETRLTPPVDLANGAGFVAAVNANPWTMVSPPPKGERPVFAAWAPCNVTSWVVCDGVARSPLEGGNWCFWIDPARRGHVGAGKAPQPARQAVAGFAGLLREGRVLPAATEVVHPRTALGLDEAGRWLTLVVVDGRQPGFSEGLSEFELASLMSDLGCRDALNLDGGGSSIMTTNGVIVNRPSDSTGPRPVPVMMGVRTK